MGRVLYRGLWFLLQLSYFARIVQRQSAGPAGELQEPLCIISNSRRVLSESDPCWCRPNLGVGGLDLCNCGVV